MSAACGRTEAGHGWRTSYAGRDAAPTPEQDGVARAWGVLVVIVLQFLLTWGYGWRDQDPAATLPAD